MFAKEMDALYMDCHENIIGGSSYGEKKITGQHKSMITRIHRVANTGFMKVWCGTHQLNFIMKLFYLSIPDTFYLTFTSVGECIKM